MSVEVPVVFNCHADQLVGVIHKSKKEAKAGVVIVVGGPQFRVGSHRMFVRMARYLAICGYPVLRFDFRGMGDSEGDFPGFECVDEDIDAAVSFLVDNAKGLKNVVLFGLCDGATAAALYRPRDSRITAKILLNPWVHTAEGEANTFAWHYYPKRLFSLRFWKLFVNGQLNFRKSIGEFYWTLRSATKWHIDLAFGKSETAGYVEKVRDGLAEYANPILVLTSENDFTAKEFINLLEKDRTWQPVKENIELMGLKSADHTVSTKAEFSELCRITQRWLQKQHSSFFRSL